MKLIFFALIFYFAGCSSSFYEDCLKISPNKMEAWVDLMPGGEGSFLFAGYFQIDVEDTCEIETELDATFEIFQDENKKYSAAAFAKLDGIDYDSIKNNYALKYLVTPKEKMKPTTVTVDIPVDIKINVDCCGEKIYAIYNSISVMKVY